MRTVSVWMPIELIKHFNSILKKRDPGVLSIAEESTAFPMITGSLDEGDWDLT